MTEMPFWEEVGLNGGPRMNLKTQDKLQNLTGLIQSMGRVLVAFSGGVDSSFLAIACLKAAGRQRMLAVTGTSESLAQEELQGAVALARD